MPTFDLDKDESVFSALEFVIDKKKFKIVNCTKKAIDAIADMPLHEQFATLCNVAPEEIEELNFFKIRAAMAKFFDAIMKPIIAEAESMIALRDKALAKSKKKVAGSDKGKKDEAVKKEKNASRGGHQK